jgi:hypothetical protein
MPGKVYAFNCYDEKVTALSVSGYNAGNIDPWADGTGSALKYTPSGLAVDRVKDIGSSAAFAIGDNAVVIPWDSFRGAVTVTIPDPKNSDVSLDDDLVLYLTKNEAILLTTRGFVKANFKVNLTQLAAAETAP